MEDILIDLTFRESDFTEIYYLNGNKNIFAYSSIKKISFRILLLAIASTVIYFFSINFPILSWLLIIGIIVIGISISRFFVLGFRYYSRKNRIDKYLKELSGIQYFRLILKGNSFESIQDSETKIEKWGNIRLSTIGDKYIWINSSSGDKYLFPAKSMKPEEFERLKELIKDKTK